MIRCVHPPVQAGDVPEVHCHERALYFKSTLFFCTIVHDNVHERHIASFTTVSFVSFSSLWHSSVSGDPAV